MNTQLLETSRAYSFQGDDDSISRKSNDHKQQSDMHFWRDYGHYIFIDDATLHLQGYCFLDPGVIFVFLSKTSTSW